MFSCMDAKVFVSLHPVIINGNNSLMIPSTNNIIGRQKEIALLNQFYQSNKAELVAVYGRRRIGKTFLIDKTFGEKYDFYMTGIYEGTRAEQLANFSHPSEK